MATNNDITGDRIVTKSPSKSYRDNWDNIFGKKEGKDGTRRSKETDEDTDRE